MGVIFISHSGRRDIDQAIKVRDWLASRGWHKVFWDLDPGSDLATTQRWQEALADEKSAVVIVLLSPDWIVSPRCQSEFLVAKQLAKPILPLLIAPVQYDDLKKLQIDLLVDVTTPEKETEGFKRLARAIHNLGISTSQNSHLIRHPGSSAPADASAFAPKELRRGSPELIRVAIHQPRDLRRVIRDARNADRRTHLVPQEMQIGDVAFGAAVGVSLDVSGGTCEGALQRRVWSGDPLTFNFTVEPHNDARQAVITARVFLDDANIGAIVFVRKIVGPKARAAPDGATRRLKRYRQVFLSYSSRDREVVSAIAAAYQSARVPHFWDRTGLSSGEEWSPRLRREIERADLFHLCWSKSAAASEWVEKEAAYALTRRRRHKRPDITVQMLDGPPWARHPDSLSSINFDDFVRAATVGYARGDGVS